MRLKLLLGIANVLFLFSCTDEKCFNENRQQQILELKDKYELIKVESPNVDLSDLQVTPVDSLSKFLEEFQKLRGIRIPIKMNLRQADRLQIGINLERFNNTSRIKTRSETVLVNEYMILSLGTLIMNVWLDIETPAVIASEITGLTVFDRWEQRAADASKGGDVIHFSVYGVWYYKIFIDGIGDIFSRTCSFNGTYNIKTGVGDLNII